MSTPWNPFKVATTTHNTFLSLRERNPWHPFIVDQNTFYLPPLFLSLSLSLSHTHTHTLSLTGSHSFIWSDIKNGFFGQENPSTLNFKINF